MLQNIPLELIPIEDDGFHIRIRAEINGKAAGLLIDTGATRTVFDSTRIVQFLPNANSLLKETEKLSTGLGTNSMKSHSTIIQQFKLGKLLLKNYSAIVIDIVHINQSYEQLKIPAIDGVVGGDILEQYGAVIDYSNKILQLKQGVFDLDEGN